MINQFELPYLKNFILGIIFLISNFTYAENLDFERLRFNFTTQDTNKNDIQVLLKNELKSYTSNITTRALNNSTETLNIRGFELNMTSAEALKKINEISGNKDINCISYQVSFDIQRFYEKMYGDVAIKCTQFPFYDNNNNDLMIYFSDKKIKLIILEANKQFEHDGKIPAPEYFNLFLEKYKVSAKVDLIKTNSKEDCKETYHSSFRDMNNSILYFSGCADTIFLSISGSNSPIRKMKRNSRNYILLASNEYLETTIHNRLNEIFNQINNYNTNKDNASKSNL